MDADVQQRNSVTNVLGTVPSGEQSSDFAMVVWRPKSTSFAAALWGFLEVSMMLSGLRSRCRIMLPETPECRYTSARVMSMLQRKQSVSV